MINKYPGTCNGCGQDVPARSGVTYRVGRTWIVRCPDCAPDTSTASPRGRCIDSPACGCCDQEFALTAW